MDDGRRTDAERPGPRPPAGSRPSRARPDRARRDRARRDRGWRRRTAGVAALVGAGVLLVTAGAAPGAAHQRGTVPAPGPVTVVGAPLVHTFDLDVPGDLVEGRWTVTGDRSAAVPYDGVLEPVGVVSPDLAEALVVEYGRVGADGEVLSWHDAGTLARPQTYGHALATSPAVSAATPTSIPVRVSLPDPGSLTALAGQVLTVEARFTISYLDDGSGTSHGLAVTGLWPWWLAVAAVLVALGALLSRARRAPDDPPQHAGPGAPPATRP